MFAKPPLLTIQQGVEGTFVSWLKDLGLTDLLKNHPLPKLVEWGWLMPQYRVIFPVDYFLAWQNFPLCPAQIDFEKPAFDTEGDLWASFWCIDSDQSNLWFLHPFFHVDDVCYNLLREGCYTATTIPEAFVHPYRSIQVIPYADYFFHWQAYALIDVALRADCFLPILNTPDIEEDTQRVIQSATRLKQKNIKPSDVLSEPNNWGGLAEPMTWLSHYRAFRDALIGNNDETLHKKGAKQLAEHFCINADILEKAIESKLLPLAQRWLLANEKCCKWTLQAWPYLQKDIRFALEWLYILSDNNLSFYLDKWAYKSFGEREWTDLRKVLPYEFFEDKQYFLRYIPFYEKHYKGVLPTNEKLKQLIDRLQSENYSFCSLLNAFRQLHESLVHNPKRKGSLDFRVLLPLDYYSLLAIRVESCFYDALEGAGLLTGCNKQDLAGYIIRLAEQKKITSSIIEYFKTNESRYTQLRDKPENPIGKIMDIQCKKWSKKDTHLVQAFLCCVLARNYFAHHRYLDKELIRSEKSAFMLTGILITVLVLLDNFVEKD